MATTTKLLPVQKYTFIDISFNGEGQRCQNCNRVVHYVGEVWGRTDDKHYFIGMDCAKTVTEARDFKYHDRQFTEVRKAIKALDEYEALPPGSVAYLKEHGEDISCVYDKGFSCIILKIPRHGVADFSDMIGPKDWDKIYLPVQDKLTSLGIALPEVPE